MILVFIITVGLTLAFALAVRGIYFYGRSTDNHEIIRAAANAEQWGTLSGMHKFAKAKAHMKEFAVAALAVTQRLLGDRQSDYPLVVLCAVCNAVSALLIFAIALNYWGPKTAFLLFVLFMFSFWPFLIALWGGVVAVAQVVALGSIYCLQLAETATAVAQLVWYGTAGVLLALVIFSSASSRKYLPLIAAAFFWSLRGEFQAPLAGAAVGEAAAMAMAVALVLGVVFLKVGGDWLMDIIYTRKGPAFLSNLIHNRTRTLQEYCGIMNRITVGAGKITVLLAAYVLAGVVCVQSSLFWPAHLAVGIGFFLTVLMFVFPNVGQALLGYYVYSQYGKPIWRSRFYNYRDFFASIGHPIPEDTRGAGWPWVLKYLNVMVPAPLYLSIAGIVVLVFVGFGPDGASGILAGVGMLLLSLSPVFMAEWSRAVQVGRSYFPAFVGILAFLGFVFSFLVPLLIPPAQSAVWAFAWIVAGLGAVHGGRIYFSDVLPGRLAVNRLVTFLRRRGIKEFYTYDTAFNDVFVHCMPQDVKKEFDIHFIKSIKDVQAGHVVVPPLNAKGSMMSDFPLARQATNIFEQDAYLNTMIESKTIEAKALACLPSMSSSRIWQHEAEVSSFRHLILKEVTAMDFYRGRAWVLKI